MVKRPVRHLRFITLLVFAGLLNAAEPLTLSWTNNMLRIHGDHLPGGMIETWYIEAYCRPHSTTNDWHKTVIPHKTTLLSASPKALRLRCDLEDGVRVTHRIEVEEDAVKFNIEAHNPGTEKSDAWWAQPCVRVGKFTGRYNPTNKYEYIEQCFVFQGGKAQFMPTPGWGTKARYTPGQVWTPRHVDPAHANPRPHNTHRPSNGLIGAISGDKKYIFATAFEPYQELFQGVIHCIHSDFRIGGLAAGETQKIRGKMYIVTNDLKALETRYLADFPEHDGPGWDRLETYRTIKLQGWTIHLHPGLEHGDPLICKKALAEMEKQLKAIIATLPEKAVQELQKTPVWMEDKDPRHACACYHPSAKWLRKNGFNPTKAGSVEISNAHTFVDWCGRSQPWMMLHEFAHAYHHKFLGHDTREIIQQYHTSLRNGLYGRVKTTSGRRRQHYASTNEKEYFAEATEAYFGKNDFYPFNRAELLKYDPATYRLIESMWEIKPD